MAFVTHNYPDDEQPLEVVLFCPVCKFQHIDAPDEAKGWTDPPHRSHLCLNPDCGHIWRPANVATRGVARVGTRGKSDTWPRDGEPIVPPFTHAPLPDGAINDAKAVYVDIDPIPAEVYYSREHDNFYHVTTRGGQGNHFYRKWRARRDEFPGPPR